MAGLANILHGETLMISQREARFDQKHLPIMVVLGLLISAVLVASSIRYYIDNKQYIQLAISAPLLILMILVLRRTWYKQT